ncbi:MAG: hypothetical protein WAZ98_03770 [Cyclobacteriaceae bacterium]
MSQRKQPHINKIGAGNDFNKFQKHDYSFVFSESIEKWIGQKRVRIKPEKPESKLGASTRMKMYHKRMPAIGSQK